MRQKKQAAQRACSGQEPCQRNRRNYQNAPSAPQFVGVAAPPKTTQVSHLLFQYSRLVLGFFNGHGRACARLGDICPNSKRRCHSKLRLNAVADLAQNLVVWQRTKRFWYFGDAVHSGRTFQVRWRETHALIREALPSTARRRPVLRRPKLDRRKITLLQSDVDQR